MRNALVILFCYLFFTHLQAQLSNYKIKDQAFVEASIDNVSFLCTNVDSVKWNKALLPLGFKSIPSSQKVVALEYKKEKDGISEYINFDDRYMVLTIIWKDASGKNMISRNLKKTLRKKEYNSSGTYKINFNGFDFIISMESNKDKAVYEMITVEQERK